MKFQCEGISGGVWSGVVTSDSAPGRLCVLCEGQVVAEAALTGPVEGPWRMRADLPGRVISDGVQTLLLCPAMGAAGDAVGPDAPVIGRLDIRAGKPVEPDLLAEIALLRAEMDLMKREFRRLASGG